MVKLMVGLARILPLCALLLVLPALAAAQPRPTTASPPCPLLFRDSFDNGIGNGWTREGEGFHTADGQLTHTGPRGTLWLGHRDWTDVVVDVDVSEAGCGGDYAAILLRMQDISNYVGVVMAHAGCLFANGLKIDTLWLQPL